jgi:hypothetical protein
MSDQQHIARRASLWLRAALRWRAEAAQCKTEGGRAQARRYMRQAANCYRRQWAAL